MVEYHGLRLIDRVFPAEFRNLVLVCPARNLKQQYGFREERKYILGSLPASLTLFSE
jgi:hypothetical protein